ncbi:MAG: hypothetical protein H6565_16020 [Lewinellaceae bacterium]|nr:hypothetical protein [Lewinellaceae bacterium]
MRKILVSIAFLSLTVCATAQYGGPRLFLDVPSIYFTTPDVEHIGDRLGGGAEIAMNVGTHWGVVRGGGGATFTLDPNADDVGESFLTTPYALLEAGAGMFRSNGNKCAKTNQNAFTAMAKGGIFYNFAKAQEGVEIDRLDYTLGAEFGYFYIRDVFKNYELFLAANYFTKAKVVGANFGFRMFLNLRANR